MEKKPSGGAEVDELEERQARLAAREAKKQERLKSKLARESQRAEQGWIDECKRGKLLEEAEQQKQEVEEAGLLQRTQEQYKQISKWERAIGAPRPQKEDASAEGGQTWQTSMLDASTLAMEKANDKAALTEEYNIGKQSKFLQKARKAGMLQIGAYSHVQDLLEDLQGSTHDEQPLQQFAPIENRKVRILALHGTPGNSNIMKFATTQLRKAVGNTKVEWLFLEAPNVWEPKENPNRPSEEPISDFERRIANGQPFLSWLDYTQHEILNAEECCEYLEEQCHRLAPIDFVVAFSQAAHFMSIFIDKLRQRGEAVPWRLSIFFCGGQIVQRKYIFRKSHPHPIMAIYGGDKDPYTLALTQWLPAMYSNLQLFEHQDGHVFPTKQPRAAEIYNAIAEQIWKHAYVEAVD